MNEKEITTKSSYDDRGDTHPTLLSKSDYFEFLHRKSERLATALYMITNFIKDSDPMKLRIREKALIMLSMSLSFGTTPLLERKGIFREFEASVKEIISLISIGFRTNLISEMNYSVLKNELENFNKEISSEESKASKDETVSLSPEFFDMGQVPNASDRTKLLLKDINNTTYNKQDSEYFNKGQKASYAPIKQGGFARDNQQIRTNNPSVKVVDSKKDNRHEVILGLLKKKDGLGIKDFATSISDCSEKTIQRELQNMIESGSIRKEGDRRWSRYYIA